MDNSQMLSKLFLLLHTAGGALSFVLWSKEENMHKDSCGQRKTRPALYKSSYYDWDLSAVRVGVEEAVILREKKDVFIEIIRTDMKISSLIHLNHHCAFELDSA